MEHMASALVVYPCFITKHIQFCSFHAVLHYSGRDPGRSAQDYQKYLGIRSASCLVKYRLGWNVYSHVTMQLSQYKNSYNQRNTNIGIKVDVFIYRQTIQHCHTEQESHTAQKEGPNHKESLGGMPESVPQPHPRQRSVIAGAAGLSLNAFLSVTQRGHRRNGKNLPRRHGKADKNHRAGKKG